MRRPESSMNKIASVHPLLFALFPVLFLYSANAASFPLRVILVPSLIVMVIALAVWAAAHRLMRDHRRAALLVSWFFILFFAYGRVHDALWHFLTIEPLTIGPDKVLFPLGTILFVIGVLFIIKTRRSLHFWNRLANIASVLLVVVSLLTITVQRWSANTPASPLIEQDKSRATGFDSAQATQYPDIYYIILDGYGRADILRQLYDYDNSAMLAALADRGFFTASRAHANYCQTGLSLASALNMRYLDSERDRLDPASRKPTPIKWLIAHSRVADFLRQRSYQTVAFSTGYHPTEIKNADVFISTETTVWFLDEFQSGLVSTTPLPFIIGKLRRLPFFPAVNLQFESNAHRQRILRTLGHLANLRPQARPRFIFAHLILPHPPFLFDHRGPCENQDNVFRFADGSDVIGRGIPTSGEYTARYVEQLRYTNQLVLEVIDTILARTVRAPVIIVQSDHGPGSQLNWRDADQTNLGERFSILNACYLPDGGNALLADDLNPINTFRAVFNHYFDTTFEQVAQRSFFSSPGQPYQFTEITGLLPPAALDTAQSAYPGQNTRQQPADKKSSRAP